jgi:hypothetical protein
VCPSYRELFLSVLANDSVNKVKVKVILRPTVSRPVRPAVRHSSGTRDQFLPFSLCLFLDSCRFVDVGRPLWREVVSVVFSFCRASPAQPFSDLSPPGFMCIFYCLYFWDSPNLEGQVPVLISPRYRVAELYPRALGLSNLRKHVAAVTNTRYDIIAGHAIFYVVIASRVEAG